MAEDTEPKKLGRAFKFSDPVELKQQIDLYFNNQDPHFEEVWVETGRNQKVTDLNYEKMTRLTPQKPYTISGLARHLGCDRVTLLRYKDPAYFGDHVEASIAVQLSHSIQEAFRRVEEHAEEQLYGPGSNGAKFVLTNNYKWIEKSTVDPTGKTQAEMLDEVDDIADQAEAQLEDSDAGSETPE